MNKPDEETLERLRVRIAELRGWRVMHSEFYKLLSPPGVGPVMCCGKDLADEAVLRFGLKGDECGMFLMPDYPRDLNACHEAERALIDGRSSRWEDYLDKHLDAICEECRTPTECAEAWQRCVAMDRTLSKEPIV